MSDITLSKAVRSNLLNLQNTAGLLSKSQERLSSGLRVNSALDNPTNFFTAQGLNSRANDLKQLSDAVSNAVQTVAAADKGITAITKLVESAQATARQALQTAATVSQTTVTQASHNGSADVPGTHTGGALTVNGVSITIGANDTAADIVSDLQAASGFGSANFTVTDNAGTLEFDGTNGAALVISGAGAAQVNLTAGTYNSTSTTTDIANPKRAELVETYNDLIGQIDALAKDSGFNGVNLLNGDDLSVIFNEDGSSSIEIEGVDNTSTGLGLSSSLASTSFDTNSGINSVLDDLKGVIDDLRGQASKFGANLSVVETRQDFTKSMINVLQTGAANLTLADTNEEAANVLALQTRQQLSSTALSLASQADQNVLRLF